MAGLRSRETSTQAGVAHIAHIAHSGGMVGAFLLIQWRRGKPPLTPRFRGSVH